MKANQYGNGPAVTPKRRLFAGFNWEAFAVLSPVLGGLRF